MLNSLRAVIAYAQGNPDGNAARILRKRRFPTVEDMGAWFSAHSKPGQPE
jgi:hypothetical protein